MCSNGNMPSRSAVFSQRIEGRHYTCTFPPAPPAASPQPGHSVSDSREWPIGRRGEGDTGKRYYQYHSKTGCDDKRRIVEIKRPFTIDRWAGASGTSWKLP